MFVLGDDQFQGKFALVTGGAAGIGDPRDVANVSRFLLSDETSFITGAGLLVDGGTHAKLAITSIWDS